VIRTVFLSSSLLIVSVFIQSTWLSSIAVLGVIPDISLVILIWVSFKNGPIEGAFSGFLAGLAEDCISASPLGFHTFLKTIVASITSLLHGSFAIDRIFIPFILGCGATLFKAIAASILSLLFGPSIHVYNFFARDIWIEVAYNGLLSPFFFFLLSLFAKYLITDQAKK